MDDQESECRKWEKAYLAQSHDAAVGKIFKGIIHNMNGEIQALSMQSELFFMAFEQLSAMLLRAIESTAQEELRNELEKMGDLLRRRSSLLPQMQQAVRSLKETVRRATIFGESIEDSNKQHSSLSALIRSEEKFLCGDSFFKHKVERQLILADTLSVFSEHHSELRYIVFVLLANALEALKKKSEPPWSLQVETKMAGGQKEIIVKDNGNGIASDDQGHIFEPFFSGWPEGAGLGLYLAKKAVMSTGGTMSFESLPGCTRFLVSWPADRI